MEKAIRERILDSAESLMTRFGFGKVTVGDIAREGSLSRASVYLHFRDKTEIGLALIDRLHLRVLNHLEEIAARPGTAIQRLQRLLVGRVLFAFDAAQGTTMKYEEIFAAIRAKYMIRREQYFEAEARLFASALQDGVAKAEIKVGSSELTGLVLVLATNAFMPFNLSPRQLRNRSEIEHRVTLLSELLLGGVIRRSPKSAQHPRQSDKSRNPRRIHVNSK
jgi:AcrR family transcriptional regulator